MLNSWKSANKRYQRIKYKHDTVEDHIYVIINADNLVIPISTFHFTLIRLNTKLKNKFIYDIFISF